jgi:DNA end-binding protein Ku
MDALRRSLGQAGKPAKKSRKASSGQKEMLMPIEGKKAASQTGAKKPASRPQRRSAY